MIFAGGSSRVDEPAQLFVELAAIVTGTAAFLVRLNHGGRRLRAPFWVLAAFATVMACQLVPLPPGLWEALPGRKIFVGIALLVGEAGRWRPVSVTPDSTISALLGLLPAFATLIALSTIPRNRIPGVLYALALCIIISAVLGISQIIAGERGIYFYHSSDYGVASGVFANRNHAALFAALGFPLTAVLLSRIHENGYRPPQPAILAIAGMLAMLCLVANVATGSRAGLLTGLVGIASAMAFLAPMVRRWMKRHRPGRTHVIVLVCSAVILALAVGGLLASSHWASFERFRSLSIASDGRVVLLGPNLELARAYFPFGAGFGSFPQIFRVIEPFGNLDLTYTNHAHNDWLEVVIEGGIFAIAAAIVAAVWLARRIAALRRVEDGAERRYGWLGVTWIGMILIASVFDYPLRTPMFAMIWIVAMALIVIACTPPQPMTSADRLPS